VHGLSAEQPTLHIFNVADSALDLEPPFENRAARIGVRLAGACAWCNSEPRRVAGNVRQEKTGVELIIPVHPTLATIIAAAPRDHLTFVTTRQGKPFQGSAFSRWFRDECDKAGLSHCSAHGLRKAAARRLAEAGAPPTRSARSQATRASLNLCATPGPLTSAALPRRP
jgi:integrase